MLTLKKRRFYHFCDAVKQTVDFPQELSECTFHTGESLRHKELVNLLPKRYNYALKSQRGYTW